MEVFTYLYGQARQDAHLVNAGSAHLFKHLSMNSKIKTITMFSDGAPTYHAAEAIVATPKIAESAGIKCLAWNFFESQVLSVTERLYSTESILVFTYRMMFLSNIILVLGWQECM